MLAGYPVVDVKVTLFDGSYHDVDSNEMAFKIAGSMAFKDAMSNAKPVILEPIMKVEVVTPEDYYGDIVGDLNRRRGQIIGMEDSISGKVVTAEVPLAEMFRYSTSMRSMSQGRADVHDGIRQVHGSAVERRRRDHQERLRLRSLLTSFVARSDVR